MPEFVVFVLGVGTMFGGYHMALRGNDITKKPPFFYLGWAFMIIGGTVAQGAVFYAMWR